MSSTAIRILIADDHKIVRDALTSIIGENPGMKVIACVADGRKAVESAKKLHPAVIMMDVMMPEMNGIDATQMIVKEKPGTRVIGLSMYADLRYVLGMLKAGASGYLLKDCSSRALIRGIRDVAKGGTCLSPQIADVLHGEHCSRKQGPAPCAALSSRERQILQLLAEGLSSKEIAAQFLISVKTIQTHRCNMQSKLGIRGSAELTKYAVREGLVNIEG